MSKTPFAAIDKQLVRCRDCGIVFFTQFMTLGHFKEIGHYRFNYVEDLEYDKTVAAAIEGKEDA